MQTGSIGQNFSNNLKQPNIISTINLLEGDNLSNFDAKKLQEIDEYCLNLEVNDKNKKYISPLKSFLTVSLLAVSGFMGGKIVAGRIAKYLDSKTRVIDFISKGLNKSYDYVTSKFPKNTELKKAKNFKEFVNTSWKSTVNFVIDNCKKYSKKGIFESDLENLKAEEIKNIYSKNFVKKSVASLIGVATGATALVEAAADRNKDGVADASQLNQIRQEKILKNLALMSLE